MLVSAGSALDLHVAARGHGESFGLPPRLDCRWLREKNAFTVTPATKKRLVQLRRYLGDCIY
eukprot:11227463-Lingulodinium_polyedra.AAC.1